MKNKTKTVKIALVLAIIVIIAISLARNEKKDGLIVGAILPLSGPASIWGENVQKGIELALEDKSGMKVLYEDSKGKPADGISAYQVLKTKKADIMLSALSAVSVPVSKAANEDKFPLFATLTAADGIVNPYTVRYYSNANNFASPSFTDASSPLKQAKNIAILYRNDDLGRSVFNRIIENAKNSDISISMSESFNPNETDFNTLLAKVKNSKSDALLFVPVTPGEATGIVKTAQALSLTVPLIEASNVFADTGTRKEVAGIPFYSNVYLFSKNDDQKIQDFKKRYAEKYGGEPNFAVAFGYDAANLMYSCKDQRDRILECIKSNKTNDGITGLATQIADGDFNVPMIFDSIR